MNDGSKNDIQPGLKNDKSDTTSGRKRASNETNSFVVCTGELANRNPSLEYLFALGQMQVQRKAMTQITKEELVCHLFFCLILARLSR